MYVCTMHALGGGRVMCKSCVLSPGRRVSHTLGGVPPAELAHLANLTISCEYVSVA